MSRGGHRVSINERLCKGVEDCGICIYVCPADVFGKADRLTHRGIRPPALLRPEACTGCQNCMIYCPDFAVVVERASGAKSADEAGRPS